MTAWITSVALLAFAPALALAQEAIVVGAAVSQSGSHAAEAEEYWKGLIVWQEELNARGGLLGRRVDLRVLDDGSDAVGAGAAYAQLIRDGAAALIGPYGSAATLAALAEAERAGRVMINAGGASVQVHKRAPRFVFQALAPYASFGTTVIDAAKAANVVSVMLLTRDDAGAREMAEAAAVQAKRVGLNVAEIEVYPGDTTDFLPQVYKAMANQTDAWIAFGEPRDAADMVKTFKRQGFSPRFFYVRGAADPRFVRLVGQDAEFTLGSKDYDPAFSLGDNAAFVRAYAAKWSAKPGTLATQGYTAGTVLAEAVRRAGTLDPAKLRATLSTLEMDTVLGHYKVDPSTGIQLGMKPTLLQMQRGRFKLVWPREWAGAAQLLPYAAWDERRLIE